MASVGAPQRGAPRWPTALRRENRTPDDLIVRWSAAAADQHFKVLIVIEPNLDRVWAALMAGAQPGRTPFTVLQLATSASTIRRRFAASSFGAPTPNGAPSRSSP